MLLGLIADTHGLIRPEALQALRGSELIVHAGDVGRRSVLDALQDIAPVRVVCGNVDVDAREQGWPPVIDCVFAGVTVHVSHGHEIGRPTPRDLAARYSADVIVYGHTHRATVQWVGRTLVVNPGAAGPARFKLKPSVGLLTLPAREAQIVWL